MPWFLVFVKDLACSADHAYSKTVDNEAPVLVEQSCKRDTVKKSVRRNDEVLSHPDDRAGRLEKRGIQESGGTLPQRVARSSLAPKDQIGERPCRRVDVADCRFQTKQCRMITSDHTHIGVPDSEKEFKNHLTSLKSSLNIAERNHTPLFEQTSGSGNMRSFVPGAAGGIDKLLHESIRGWVSTLDCIESVVVPLCKVFPSAGNPITDWN